MSDENSADCILRYKNYVRKIKARRARYCFPSLRSILQFLIIIRRMLRIDDPLFRDAIRHFTHGRDEKSTAARKEIVCFSVRADRQTKGESRGARRRKGRFCRYKPSTIPGGLARSEQRGGPRVLWQVSHITTAIRFLRPFSLFRSGYTTASTRLSHRLCVVFLADPFRGISFLPLLVSPSFFLSLFSSRD